MQQILSFNSYRYLLEIKIQFAVIGQPWFHPVFILFFSLQQQVQKLGADNQDQKIALTLLLDRFPNFRELLDS